MHVPVGMPLHTRHVLKHTGMKGSGTQPCFKSDRHEVTKITNTFNQSSQDITSCGSCYGPENLLGKVHGHTTYWQAQARDEHFVHEYVHRRIQQTLPSV